MKYESQNKTFLRKLSEKIQGIKHQNEKRDVRNNLIIHSNSWTGRKRSNTTNSRILTWNNLEIK